MPTWKTLCQSWCEHLKRGPQCTTLHKSILSRPRVCRLRESRNSWRPPSSRKKTLTESGGAKQGPPKLISAQKHKSAACGQTGVSTPILNVAVPPVAV
eukprot:UN2048